jgi:NADH dehydrogenase
VRFAITGGTGFVGGHFAKWLVDRGHEVVVVARGVDDRTWAHEVLALNGVRFVRASLSDTAELAAAFAGCDGVAHCAGINRELAGQSYELVHVRGTEHVVRAAQRAGVARLAITSYLRARPGCGSAYLESKWAAEEIVRASSLRWTVLKPGMMFGRGDHMLDHLSHALCTYPVFVGVGHCLVRPLAVDDLSAILGAALVEGRLDRQTLGVVGPTQLQFNDAAKLVSTVMAQPRPFVTLPMGFHSMLATISERTMSVPLITSAQVRILKEQVVTACNAPDDLPEDLVPSTTFDASSIGAGLPERGQDSRPVSRWHATQPRVGAPGGTLLFDGDCGFCTTAATAAAKGFQHGERAVPWRDAGDDFLAAHELSNQQVRDAAWWVDDTGRRERGHRAVGYALVAAGGFKARCGVMMLTPPLSWIAALAYRVVVRWRYKLPGGTPACHVARSNSSN